MKSQDVYTLCNASEAHRLSLIEELAGLKVYKDTRTKTHLEIKVSVLKALALMCYFFVLKTCRIVYGFAGANGGHGQGVRRIDRYEPET